MFRQHARWQVSWARYWLWEGFLRLVTVWGTAQEEWRLGNRFTAVGTVFCAFNLLLIFVGTIGFLVLCAVK